MFNNLVISQLVLFPDLLNLVLVLFSNLAKHLSYHVARFDYQYHKIQTEGTSLVQIN